MKHNFRLGVQDWQPKVWVWAGFYNIVVCGYFIFLSSDPASCIANDESNTRIILSNANDAKSKEGKDDTDIGATFLLLWQIAFVCGYVMLPIGL